MATSLGLAEANVGFVWPSSMGVWMSTTPCEKLLPTGAGFAAFSIDPASLDTRAVQDYVQKSHELTLTGFLMDIIPKTLLSPLVGDNILQVLLVAVLFGISLARVGESGRPVLSVLEALVAPVFRLVHLLMRAAPIGQRERMQRPNSAPDT